MCECKREVEERLLENFIKDKPEGADHKVELAGYGFLLNGKKMQHRPLMPFVATYLHTFKNGNKKIKTIKGSMALMYCPFCGVKVNTSTQG